MLNRIASFHNYQSVQNDLRRTESKVHHNQAQLASGKKLMKASDEPLATHYIQNIGQQKEQLRQYTDAIGLTAPCASMASVAALPLAMSLKVPV